MGAETLVKIGEAKAPLILGLQPAALIDHVARVDWSLLHQTLGERGGSIPVLVIRTPQIVFSLFFPLSAMFWTMKRHILASADEPSPMKTMAGGSVANTFRGLSFGFGVNGGMFGAYGDDKQGYGPTDCRYRSYSSISGRAATLSPCSSHSHHRICTQVKIRSLKCSSRGISVVCRAGSSGHRRNPNFSRQRHGFRGKNMQNEERENLENIDESEMISSKNGPLLSLSGSTKFQAAAAPGPREKEIVELFRKVQTKLQEKLQLTKIRKLKPHRREKRVKQSILSLNY
ncbi:rho-N domain-containing protein 1 [Hibiscus syriacus]|uniref:Rho-N domain-containing protein 1 n=1 Tax=Hibiscus syriacus TaxID=106335 RepID=A0A6A3AYK7_HIBSY|nr:rho-N domain-containing protein 1 [Hibiscus syriacus]